MSEAQNSIPRPPYTQVYFFTQGKGEGGGVLNQREGERGNRGEYRSQSWVENSNMIECTQEHSDKHLQQCPFPGKFFYMTTFGFDFYESFQSTVGKVHPAEF